jgi:hypothetical protein
VTPEDRHYRKTCAKHVLAIDEMREQAATEYGSWSIVEGNGGYFACGEAPRTIVEIWEQEVESFDESAPMFLAVTPLDEKGKKKTKAQNAK